jgi:hypothetical protein
MGKLASHGHLVEILGLAGKHVLHASEHRLGLVAREDPLVRLLARPAFDEEDGVGIALRPAYQE